MKFNANTGGNMDFTAVTDEAQTQWDSEKRNSPYSTVADPNEDTYCEGCDSTVTYSGPDDKHGTCGCDFTPATDEQIDRSFDAYR